MSAKKLMQNNALFNLLVPAIKQKKRVPVHTPVRAKKEINSYAGFTHG
jgi:hypothetical protein